MRIRATSTAKWILPPVIDIVMLWRKIAKESPLSESEVAQKAIQLAHEGAEGKGSDDRAAHVGFT